MEDFLLRLGKILDPATLESATGGSSLIAGFLIGLAWGLVLQKGRICKYDVVSGLFRLQDFTVFRLGAPMLLFSTVLIFFFLDLGMLELSIPKTVIVPQIVGGLLFGAGIAILGYCPGTSLGALGEGSLDAIPGILGMITGAVIFAELFYDSWNTTFMAFGDIGRITFYDMFKVNHWYVIVPFCIMLVMFIIGVTMMDWFMIFFRKSLNYFLDVTDALEEKVPTVKKEFEETTEKAKAQWKKYKHEDKVDDKLEVKIDDKHEDKT
ncbi:MAG: YeeE/YedE family protein [Nitrospirae bacterium]|nr:YeeE/YedE family protein [Nitrospirota bacterium]MBF0539913.1 YeeE/YedE family protein [Nitrospirota bacterium]